MGACVNTIYTLMSRFALLRVVQQKCIRWAGPINVRSVAWTAV